MGMISGLEAGSCSPASAQIWSRVRNETYLALRQKEEYARPDER